MKTKELESLLVKHHCIILKKSNLALAKLYLTCGYSLLIYDTLCNSYIRVILKTDVSSPFIFNHLKYISYYQKQRFIIYINRFNIDNFLRSFFVYYVTYDQINNFVNNVKQNVVKL